MIAENIVRLYRRSGETGGYPCGYLNRVRIASNKPGVAMKRLAVREYFAGLTGSTFLLALSSLFGDISSEMLYPVLPTFLTQTLKAGGSIVGLVDGFAQATQNIVQGFSGALSDKLRK